MVKQVLAANRLFLMGIGLVMALVAPLFLQPPIANAIDCGTYSAGDYGNGTSGSGEECSTENVPTTSTPPADTTPSTTHVSSGTTTSPVPNDTTVTTPVSGDLSVTLNDYKLYTNGQGQPITMTPGQKVYVAIGNESHTITLKSATADTVIVTIASTPTDVTLQKGSTVSYDVNHDGKDDIAMTYTNSGASVDSAIITFATIQPTQPAVAQSTKTPNDWWLLLFLLPVIVVATLLLRKKG